MSASMACISLMSGNEHITIIGTHLVNVQKQVCI